jgi:DNA-binding beta-propeller fold protein YncE
MLIALAALVVATLGLPAAASAATLHPGDILVAVTTGGTGKIVQVDPASGAQSLVASGSGLKDPWGLAVAADGRIFVAGDGAHTVWVVDPATGTVTPLHTEPTFSPVGLAIAPDGRLIVSDYNAGKILALDPTTGVRTPVGEGGGIMRPSHLAVTTTGRIYVADEHAVAFFSVDLASGAVNKVSSGGNFVAPYGVALTAAGLPLLEDYDSFAPDFKGAIFSIDPVTGAQTPISSGGFFEDPIGGSAPGGRIAARQSYTILANVYLHYPSPLFCVA